jgi:hypothetical protein
VNLDDIRERSHRCERTRDAGTRDEWMLAGIASAADVPALLAEIGRLTKELAEERQSHEQTVENFGDWIEDHNAKSFRLTPPTDEVGWTWKCLLCDKGYGSALREADAFGSAVHHEHRTHGGGR